MLKIRSIFSIIAFSGGFYGFYFFLLIISAAGLGFNSRLFTVPYRAGFLAFSLIFLVYKMISKCSFTRLGPLWIPLLTFWFLYFLQIAKDAYFDPVYLGMPPIEYIQKSIGIAFIPMFIFLNRLGENENKWAYRALWITVLGSCLFSLILYRDALGEGYRQIQLSNYETIDFISTIILSYIGATTVCIAVQRLTIERSKNNSRWIYIFYFTFIFVGLMILLLGGTRSAVLVCIAICAIILIMNSIKSNIFKNIVFVALALFIVASFIFITKKYGAETTRRFNIAIEQLANRPEKAGGGRIQMYLDTIHQILENPFWGSSLELKTTNFYPHNHILEAFMATGILGGISFIILVWAACKRCLKMLQYKKEYGWIACLFLVFFLRGLFSGGIIHDHLWYSMMAVFAVPIQKR